MLKSNNGEDKNNPQTLWDWLFCKEFVVLSAQQKTGHRKQWKCILLPGSLSSVKPGFRYAFANFPLQQTASRRQAVWLQGRVISVMNLYSTSTLGYPVG